MGIKSIAYIIWCDGEDCSVSSSAGYSKDFAKKDALKNGWHQVGDKWLCPDCWTRLKKSPKPDYFEPPVTLDAAKMEV